MSENKSLETLKNLNIEKLSGGGRTLPVISTIYMLLLDRPCGVSIVFQYFMTTIGKIRQTSRMWKKRGKTNDT